MIVARGLSRLPRMPVRSIAGAATLRADTTCVFLERVSAVDALIVPSSIEFLESPQKIGKDAGYGDQKGDSADVEKWHHDPGCSEHRVQIRQSVGRTIYHCP